MGYSFQLDLLISPSHPPPQAPELITAFDEHRVSPNFKFGILCQKEGQVGDFAAGVRDMAPRYDLSRLRLPVGHRGGHTR